MVSVLAPIRYPPSEHSFRTIERGVEILSEDEGEDGELIILHVNLTQGARRVTRTQLRSAVKQRLSGVPAYFVVRSGFVLEEAIVDEAANQGVDHVVIGASKPRWIQRKIASLLGIRHDLAVALETELNVGFETVS